MVARNKGKCATDFHKRGKELKIWTKAKNVDLFKQTPLILYQCKLYTQSGACALLRKLKISIKYRYGMANITMIVRYPCVAIVSYVSVIVEKILVIKLLGTSMTSGGLRKIQGQAQPVRALQGYLRQPSNPRWHQYLFSCSIRLRSLGFTVAALLH